MQQFFANLPEWLGTLPQLVSATGIIGILGLLINAQVQNRRINLDTKKSDDQIALEGSKVADAAEAKLREHFAGELTRLSSEIEKASNRQQQCEQREERLRRRVKHLEEEVSGLHRVIAFNSSTLLLGGETGQTSEAVREAAVRVLEQLASREEPKPDEGDHG